MIIAFPVLLLVILLCIFLLFVFTKNDFVLLRQNISLREIFDLAAVVAVVAFLFGRVIFAVDTFSFQMFNLLRFFHLFRFPGLSTLGFFGGGALAIFFLFKNKKGLARIFDIFSIAFLPFYVFLIFFRDYPDSIIYFKFFIPFVVILLIPLFIQIHHKYILRDGCISFLLLELVSLDVLIFPLFTKDFHPLLYVLSFSQIISIPIIILSGILFFLTQKNAKS